MVTIVGASLPSSVTTVEAFNLTVGAFHATIVGAFN
jgi:hypothetical protein